MSETLTSLFLALSDPTRLRLLRLMADGEVSVGYLADELGESQPKISRHLATLRSMGLVSTRRDGKWIYYAIEHQDDSTADSILSMAVGSSVQAVSVSNEPTRIPNRTQSVPEEMAVWLL
ncbi:MAG TPA: metalloregulator ArsR/SmtB family transcription factor [Pyrinomonadaceae bacterium]|nr:metalloregulator ArsR/SmtB family transcription factor [Pyrinomonadaceae bacterium]